MTIMDTDIRTELQAAGRCLRQLALPVAMAVVVLAVTGCNSSSSDPDRNVTRQSSQIPAGAPAAAFASPAVLPEPESWPFKQGAPGISGTGRYAWGAYYWSDFLYDANGALGGDPPADHYGSPTGGGMRYPDEPGMAENGADVFRVGMAADKDASWWRVDWQTLADVNVPVAAFGLDFEAGGLDASTEWPGVPRLRSAGVDAVLMLSAAGYQLLGADGALLGSGEVFVDLASQSFVARVPRDQLPVSDQWQVRLVAGLHDGAGGFRDEMPAFAGPPTAPPVFNAAFRDYSHEPVEQNFWKDLGQAQALAEGDISAFVITLDWSRLDIDIAEPEATPVGLVNRWYVSSIDPLEEYGRVGIDRATGIAGGHPVYLDKVQPYALWIPASYSPSQPAPLTLTLHSGSQMHNQYGVTTPNFIAEACEARGAICLSTLGRGPAGDFEGDAELDLWEAWHDVDLHYELDPKRVHSTGYSMGGNTTLRLLMKYPDVIAGGIVIAGGDDRVIDLNLLPNLRWSGYYHAHGSLDEQVPFPEGRVIADTLKALGYQYVFDHFLTEDHVAWALKDMLYPAFTDAAQWLTNESPATQKDNPGLIDFHWLPGDVNERLGVGPHGPWWLEKLKAAEGAAIARIQARSGGRPEAAIDAVAFETSYSPTPTAHQRESQYWVLGETPTAENVLELSLVQVSQLGIDLVGAGLAQASTITLMVDTDVPVRLLLRNEAMTGVLDIGPGEGQLLELDRDLQPLG